MTKKELTTKFDEVVADSNQNVKMKFNEFLNSGAVDITNHANNYLLPKVFAAAIFGWLAEQYEPLSKDGKKMLKNLRNF